MTSSYTELEIKRINEAWEIIGKARDLAPLLSDLLAICTDANANQDIPLEQKVDQILTWHIGLMMLQEILNDTYGIKSPEDLQKD